MLKQTRFGWLIPAIVAALVSACSGGGGGGGGGNSGPTPPSSPQIALSPASLTFVAQRVGTGSPSQVVQITNSGNATLLLNSLSLSGSDPAQFAIHDNCGPNVAPSTTCTVSVTYTPTAIGAASASLSVSSNAGSVPPIAISGTGVASLATVSATLLTYAPQQVGTSSSSQSIIITNAGSASLNINGIGLLGTDTNSFSLQSNCAASLAPAATCTLDISFAPSTSGAKTASIQIQSDSVQTPTVSLTGTATAPVASTSTSALSFASQSAGTASSAMTITITNTGNATLTIQGFQLGGADSSMFVQTASTCVGSLIPGASCIVSIEFAPTSTGPKNATYTLLTNAVTNPSVNLAATAVLPPAPVATGGAMSVNVLGVAPSSASGVVSASDPTGLPLNFTIAGSAASGVATVDAVTGATRYVIAGYPASQATTSDAFVVKVSNGYSSTLTTVGVALHADPLLPDQWHIRNSGTPVFSSVLPVAGNDLDAASAWASGYSGRGIKVGVIDTGLQAAHEDLAANTDVSHSVNFLTGANDPTPTVSGFDHGTSVSGIIGAVAFNGKGGRGVAYGSTLRGYNLIAPSAYSIANFATAAGGAAVSADNDLFNLSFQSTSSSLPTYSGAYQTIAQNSMSLRNGLGAALVNAAGNDFVGFEYGTGADCTSAQKYGVSCGDPASDERRGGYVPLIVGAVDANGIHSSYSTTGSALWISAPGGEFGYDSAYVSGASAISYAPAIVTTNLVGCGNTLDSAYAYSTNALDNKGANPFASQCQYTAMMNGTSAATPSVAGVVALMLEANPRLSVRDVKYILATTARITDPGFSGVAATDLIPGVGVQLEGGWSQNAAGFYFTNRYGFGVVDAAAAVSMARTYTAYLPPVANSTGNYLIQANSATQVVQRLTLGGSYGTVTVAEPFATVESVVVFVNIASTPSTSCNQIELVSPSGTKSILLHAANGFTNAAINNTRFLSNAFYGEPINGAWTLRFLDFCTSGSSPTLLSTTQPQQLLFVGH